MKDLSKALPLHFTPATQGYGHSLMYDSSVKITKDKSQQRHIHFPNDNQTAWFTVIN